MFPVGTSITSFRNLSRFLFSQQRNQFMKFFYLLTVFKIIFQGISKFILVTLLGYNQNNLICVFFTISINTFEKTLIYTVSNNRWYLNQRRTIRSKQKILTNHKIHKEIHKSLLFNSVLLMLLILNYDSVIYAAIVCRQK